MAIKRRSADLASELLASYRPPSSGLGLEGDLPSQDEVARVFEELRDLLFPGLTGRKLPQGREPIRRRLTAVEKRLARQIGLGLSHRRRLAAGADAGPPPRHEARQRARHLLERLPELRSALIKDVRAAYDSDPAATGTDEVVFCYPGVYAVTAYRVAHALWELDVPVVPRMLTEHAHARTGIDIHPAAVIGESFFIDHGTGVVIGETTVIGARVRLYQGVTLGALSVAEGQRLRGKKRHPTLEDDVVIYANATILGGKTVIGRGAVVGGNTWVTESVPAGVRVLLPTGAR